MYRIIIVLLCFTFLACSKTAPTTQVYSVQADVTDIHLAMPKSSELLELIDIQNREGNIIIRHSEINDVNINDVQALTLPVVQTGLLSNAVRQKKAVQDFRQQLEQLLAPADSIVPAPHSAIFDPIISELKYLSTLPEDYQKTLIIYSDLRENNSWMSFYSGADSWKLLHSPQPLIERYLLRAENMSAISNISVHIIYRARDNKDATEFRELQNLYTTVFDTLNIPLFFSANLSNAIRHYE